VAAFCENVGLLTVLGAEDSHEDFIVEQLRPNVERIFLYREGAPTIVKRRFVETYPFQKLFEIYIMSERDRTGAESRALCEKLESVLPQYDVVIVTDYGHGMIGPEAVQVLCEKSRFLAVNTQLNADNHGFNTISKYKRADFVSISERELRLDARSRTRDIHDVVEEAAARVGCPRMVLTQGRTGCLCYHREEGAFKVPAFTNRIVDRIGAGDALFAVTSLVVAQGAPMELVGFVANAVGAQAVGIVGNQNYVEREPLLKHVESLLK
jgi:bifunctional ADP-heptose synthase (sugar kinase/adenylyltransferase)